MKPRKLTRADIAVDRDGAPRGIMESALLQIAFNLGYKVTEVAPTVVVAKPGKNTEKLLAQSIARHKKQRKDVQGVYSSGGITVLDWSPLFRP